MKFRNLTMTDNWAMVGKVVREMTLITETYFYEKWLEVVNKNGWAKEVFQKVFAPITGNSIRSLVNYAQ